MPPPLRKCEPSPHSITEAQARSRVQQEARAIDIARWQAKRRDAEGLSMRPHPGNRLEPGTSDASGSAGRYGENAFAYGGGKVSETSAERRKVEEAEAAAAAKGKEDGVDAVYAEGGYQCAEYQPAEYDCAEYSSVYDPQT